MKLLLQILWGKQGKWQFLFAVGGFFVGLSIMLMAVQVYIDVEGLMGKNEDKSYLIINKQVTLMNTFNKEVSRFKQEELDTLLMQPFVSDIGVFKSNTFKMNAKMPMNMAFPIDLFFESIEDKYLDTIPEAFKWESGQMFIPVIISSDFLRLYNFGIAMSQKQLPQLPKEMIQQFKFDLTVKDKNDSTLTYKAQVVGYSDRIPSILVPESFMNFANNTYGTGNSSLPSRVMLEVDDLSDEALHTYLADHYYDANREQLTKNRFEKILKFVVAIAGAIGLLFAIQAFVIFIINFQLIIALARNDINILFDIGYKASTIGNILTAQFSTAILLVLASSLVLTYFLTNMLHQMAMQFGVTINTPYSEWVVIIGVGSTALVLLISQLSISRSLR